jgi:hypothetical protein
LSNNIKSKNSNLKIKKKKKMTTKMETKLTNLLRGNFKRKHYIEDGKLINQIIKKVEEKEKRMKKENIKESEKEYGNELDIFSSYFIVKNIFKKKEKEKEEKEKQEKEKKEKNNEEKKYNMNWLKKECLRVLKSEEVSNNIYELLDKEKNEVKLQDSLVRNKKNKKKKKFNLLGVEGLELLSQIIENKKQILLSFYDYKVKIQ